MANKVDMSLDDIIKLSGSHRGHPRGRASSQRDKGNTLPGGLIAHQGSRPIQEQQSMACSTAHGAAGSRMHWVPYRRPQRLLMQRQYTPSYQDSQGPGPEETSGKLFLSNLDVWVLDADIQKRFAEIGPIKKARVHYDRVGCSLGTAEVHFEHKADALKAMEQYNGVLFDGRPLSIELITSHVDPQQRLAQSTNQSETELPSPQKTLAMEALVAPGKKTPSPRGRGGGFRGNSQPKLSAEKLDEQIDA